MPSVHDPMRQANYLTQSLSQDKKPLGIFLGAGCPVAVRVNTGGGEGPLIPDIAGVTKAISEEMKKSKHKDRFQKVHSHFGEDGNGDPNIEEILSHVRGMRQVAGKDKVRGLTADDLDQLDQHICECISRLASRELPGDGTPYHKVAAWVIAIQRDYPIEIFTTNYDLLLEQALEEHRVPYFDGFVGSHQSFFDPHAIEEDRLPSRWARLWKVHGSINWYESKKGVVHRGQADGKMARRVIHPSHLKYDESRRMPYLAMRDRLRGFLKQPSAILVTSGFSFNDEHLNADIVDGLQGNPTATVFALVYGPLKNYSKATQLAATRANVNVLGEDEALIGTRRGAWIERTPADDLQDTTAVEWVSTDEKSDSPKKARFRLGDFARLGAFLGELIGGRDGQEAKPHAK